jgi:hypothetical protein
MALVEWQPMEARTEEQEQALATLVEWRDALHQRVMSEADRESGDIALWFAFIGIRNAMDKVATAFGLGSFAEDSPLVEAH